MPRKLLLAGSTHTIQTPGRYLNIIDANGKFIIDGPFGTVVGQSGFQYTLDGVTQVTFKNDTGQSIDVEWLSANIQITGIGAGAVQVSNKPVIQRIEEPISVSVDATIDKVGISSSDILTAVAAVTVGANTAIRAITGRGLVSNRRVTLQVQSDNPTVLYIGSDSTIDATKGIFLRGDKDAPGVIQLATLSEVWVFNASASVAKVGVMEEYSV